ncbi:gamma-glutamyl cyclotransferase [Roseivivax halodurans JCM 10272]|uniref:glutathione-specific gamma-glutamylcyclotransferase n=1 Tax=Roseivivax halodurans JCM 10272 TaxID=1449350 RepID=X7EG18_9RHOB|nr:gamma-glutamylcyclotransferase [Roseivivax halodurans]ETX14862.1 gamma-glutamyl cyclotransferase [Roseivivax halodurans JCM 10272]
MTLWVFGYGSLLWNPGFEVAEQRPARLHGYRRSFCMSSIHHRGTGEVPGLVLALDAVPGSHCDGLALAARPEDTEEVLAYLRARELVSSAYLERLVELETGTGETVTAVAYVIDPDHEQYVAHLTLEEQAQIIARAVGGRGPNTEYLWNTVQHLAELGIPDAELQWLSDRVRALAP